MKPSTRFTAALWVLAVSPFVWAAGETPPALVWTEQGPGVGRPQSGNVYYGGGVFNGNFYTAQLSYGPLAYARTQTGDPATARVNAYDVDTTGINGARTTVLIGDYVFFNRTDKAAGKVHVNRLNSDWTHLVDFPADNMGNDVAPEGMTTDGTSLFTTQSTSKNVIRKYSVANQADSFTLTKTLNVTVSGASTFRGISSYEGMLYVADAAGDKGVYEIDASTGDYRRLGTHTCVTAYQAVRYGNRLFVIDGGDQSGGANTLTVYTLTGGTLGDSIAYNLTTVADASHVLGLWGIGVVGTSTEVTGFWVNSSNGWVSFFSCSFSIVTCNRPFADADGDHDVDMDDFGAFQRCFGGTGGLPAGPGFDYFCACFDSNGINGVDADDLEAFEACATAPTVLWAPSDLCP